MTTPSEFDPENDPLDLPPVPDVQVDSITIDGITHDLPLTPEYIREHLRGDTLELPADWLREHPGLFWTTNTATDHDETLGITYQFESRVGPPPLGPQLFVGGQAHRAPARERFAPVRNNGGWAIKPKGGLWTSTYIPEQGSGWTEWCLAEDFRVPREGWASWLLYPVADAHVLQIDTYRDLKDVLESQFGRHWSEVPGPGSALPERWLDFERLAEAYDAIHLTEDGQWATRLSQPYSLYGWDCESVLFLRPDGIDWERTESLGTVRWGQPDPPPPPERRLRGPRRRL